MKIIHLSQNGGINCHLVLKYVLHKCCRLPIDIHCLECHKGQKNATAPFLDILKVLHFEHVKIVIIT
jgi:hypothetical protein